MTNMWDKLRRFGLEFCDLPTMLWNVTFMLRATGLNVDSRNKKRIPRSLLFISIVIAISYFYVYLFSMVWFVFWRSQQSGDVIAAMIVFSLGVTSEIGNTKLACMMFYRKKVRELVDLYLACDALVEPNSRFAKNLFITLRNVKKRAMIFWLVIIGNGVVYFVKPLLTPGRHLTEDAFILYGLEPSTTTPNYEISFLLMVGGDILTCYLPANITAFLIIITGYIEAQMLALSEEILSVWDDAQFYYNQSAMVAIEDNSQSTTTLNTIELEKENMKKVINEYIKINLIKIIKIHTTNINLSRKLDRVFHVAIALEFVLLIVGMIAELLGGLENTYVQVPFALMQVGMDCLTGQRLMDSSMYFENAVYSSKWENFDAKNMKMILLMLQASQKTMKLSAGGVTMLSFSCFMMVIRSIYSAYTTLRSTMG